MADKRQRTLGAFGDLGNGASDLSGDLADPHIGAQVIADHRNRIAARQGARRQMGPIGRSKRFPIATVDKDHRAPRHAFGFKQIIDFAVGRPVRDILLRTKPQLLAECRCGVFPAGRICLCVIDISGVGIGVV